MLLIRSFNTGWLTTSDRFPYFYHIARSTALQHHVQCTFSWLVHIGVEVEVDNLSPSTFCRRRLFATSDFLWQQKVDGDRNTKSTATNCRLRRQCGLDFARLRTKSAQQVFSHTGQQRGVPKLNTVIKRKITMRPFTCKCDLITLIANTAPAIIPSETAYLPSLAERRTRGSSFLNCVTMETYERSRFNHESKTPPCFFVSWVIGLIWLLQIDIG